MEDKLYYIWQKGESLQLSKNFNSLELQCKCRAESCKEQRISKQLIEKLQQLRDELKISLSISSGYRCVSHNMGIGGAAKSNHCNGDAVDLSLNGVFHSLDPKFLDELDLYQEDPEYTKNWIHLQTVRPASGLRRFKP